MSDAADTLTDAQKEELCRASMRRHLPRVSFEWHQAAHSLDEAIKEMNRRGFAQGRYIDDFGCVCTEGAIALGCGMLPFQLDGWSEKNDTAQYEPSERTLMVRAVVQQVIDSPYIHEWNDGDDVDVFDALQLLVQAREYARARAKA